jgi:hypothetical protein
MTIVPFLNKVSGAIINPLILLLFAVATLYLFWGIVKFIQADGSEKQKSKDTIVWGLVGMFIMFSTYGIIRLVLSSFDITPSTVPYIGSKL